MVLLTRISFGPAVTFAAGLIAVFEAAGAVAGPLFEDESPRASELRTQPGIRAEGTAAPTKSESKIYAYPQAAFRAAEAAAERQAVLRKSLARLNRAAQSSGTTQTIETINPEAISESDRRRLEDEAERQLRPALESAVQGARMLGIPGPETADGKPLFMNEAKVIETRGQARRVDEGTRVLRQAAGTAQSALVSRIFGSADESDATTSTSTGATTESGN